MGAGHAHTLHVHGHSRVHRLPPALKVAAALAFVVAVAVTPAQAWWAYGLDGVAVLVVVVAARIPPGFVAKRLLVVVPFLGAALLIPFVATGERIDVAGVSLSAAGLRSAGTIASKTLLGATTSILLAATTEVPHLLRGLDRLHAPRVLTAIAAFMVRYVEVVAGELRRTRTAMAARGYAPRWLWQATPLASSAGTLFVRAYERGERVHDAMLARGYTGRMPVLVDEPPLRLGDAALAAALPLVGAAGALVAALTGTDGLT